MNIPQTYSCTRGPLEYLILVQDAKIGRVLVRHVPVPA